MTTPQPEDSERGVAPSQIFGAVASAYDRLRPSYPGAAIDRIVECGRLVASEATMLEIGAGTGIATRQFLDRGVQVHATEPDSAMADVLRSASPDPIRRGQLTIEVATFEQLGGLPNAETSGPLGHARSGIGVPSDTSARGPFQAILAAQCWHWTDPNTRWARAHGLLRGAGVVAVMANHDLAANIDRADVVTDTYERFAPALASFVFGQHAFGAANHTDDDRFESLEVERFRWERSMSVADFVALRRTQSDHLRLPTEQLDRLLVALETALGGPQESVTVPIETTVNFYRPRVQP